MDEPLHTWFEREVLSHEKILMRFLARVCSRRDEHCDLRQDAYARVYEAALTVRPQFPKAFLFATARHLVADRLRRERIVCIQTAGGGSEFLNALVDEMSPEQQVGASQELTRLARALERLPDRCREVIWLRRVKGLSQKQVATQLHLTQKTVEKHITRGGRLLAQYMETRPLSSRGEPTLKLREGFLNPNRLTDTITRTSRSDFPCSNT